MLSHFYSSARMAARSTTYRADEAMNSSSGKPKGWVRGGACCERTVRMLVHRRTYPLWRRQPDDRGRNAGLPHCPNATFGPGSELISWVSSRVLVHYAPYQSTSALPRTSHPGGVGARGPLTRGKLIFFKAPVKKAQQRVQKKEMGAG